MKRLQFKNIFVLLIFAVLSIAADVDPDANYDRLDGTGKSGVKVNVIEWEGNLEVHVYPVGSLKGLALKLDKTNKSKPVMVIGYRFNSDPKNQLIRRAILGIEVRKGFHTYRDPSADDYDKIIVSNNVLSSQVVAFRLDPEPTRLYPEENTASKVASDDSNADGAQTDSSAPTVTRVPAKAARTQIKPKKAVEPVDPQTHSGSDDGTIRPFFSGE